MPMTLPIDTFCGSTVTWPIISYMGIGEVYLQPEWLTGRLNSIICKRILT